MKLLIQGATCASEIPGFESLPDDLDIAFAVDGESMERELPDAEIVLAWNFRSRELQQYWQKTNRLKWIHWCGAGVDAAMFDQLRNSDVILSNARGIFDRAMAETVLGYMLIVGVGTIGREFARLLNANGVECYGAGCTAREGDEDFKDIFNARVFAAMDPNALTGTTDLFILQLTLE